MAQIVRKLTPAAGRGLRTRLEAAQFAFRSDPNAVWAAKGATVSVAFYRSGKLLVQGKGGDDFAMTYLEDEATGAPLDNRDAVTEPVCGSDEAGKGDYFGPLVVAAMVVTPKDALVLREIGARDSKEMSDAEVVELADRIKKAWPDNFKVVAIGPEKYNELHTTFDRNLNKLLAWAHATAIADVFSRVPFRRAVVDQFGNESLVRNEVVKKGLAIVLEQRPRAESHPAVAAASVLARAEFLRALRRLGDEFGTPLHKGAGSPVDEVARRIFRQQGMTGLAKVAKMHFKSTEKARS